MRRSVVQLTECSSLIDLHLMSYGDNPRPRLSLNSELYFLSLVDVASIPLYLAVGPSLDVCVHSEATQQWIVDSLFPTGDDEVDPDHPEESWWCPASGQLERGILLKVTDRAPNGINAKQSITELLLYATVSRAPVAKVHLPTPIPSSPGPSGPTSNMEAMHMATDWKIYALPLSSQLLTQAAQTESPLVQESNEAHFLAPFAEDNTGTHKPPSKRKEVSSLFEDAAQHSKRLKRRGGDRVSKAMATFDIVPTSTRTVEQRKPANLTKDSSNPGPAGRSRLSRASSTVSTQSLEPPRPPSRPETFINGRSSLHRVESISSPRETSSVLDHDISIEQQNKSSLTRIVMAGMRVHGLQLRKKSNKVQGSGEVPVSDLETQIPGTPTEEESEYKLVYHQTFKAASFAFRLHMATTQITQEAMRDAVDRLLTLFCTNPLATGVFGATSSISTTSSRTVNPFDLPSASALIAGFPQDRSALLVEETSLDMPCQWGDKTRHASSINRLIESKR